MSPLTDAQREVLTLALSDAVAYRDPEEGPDPASACEDCRNLFGVKMCPDHTLDQQMTDSYLGLASELGLQLDET